MAIPLDGLLSLSGALFALGLFGVLTRRNFILILISVEVIANAAILNFIAFSFYPPSGAVSGISGQSIAVILIGLAATEVAVGLAIVLALNRLRGTLNVAEAIQLKL
ncbi:MAG: NADH-quinone oxidoreductase subunit NuoK [Euryarchaeota archaeon]|nr:NADH-quinone oxidoreductase subunit NuoK [Euryarchaeota archaeon]MDE1835212.1 NADH-quinone oxidoreductase subunit NuoK [Euryarchaeota archaeon]MDE1880069.1 NADH-quinone oxidoreductase subunit NuoK [Euryarchaeota archaeon]MDE2043508.1 NADH-quinone oxidoreductase subunit NuoK [Thermoplasmata archaeon]